jgi:hypothetical protein
VHGFGMHESLRVVGIDAGGRVTTSGILTPRRVLWLPGSRWMLELPIEWDMPPHGARLRPWLARRTTPSELVRSP